MKTETFYIGPKKITGIFDTSLPHLSQLASPDQSILLGEASLFKILSPELKSYRQIVIGSGEAMKCQASIDTILHNLLEFQADKSTMLVGIGGGVVTDIAGFVASIYKRGMRLGLVPTTVLGMVDASIGGKNGINVGLYKNMTGTIYQPEFILFDTNLLQTLPVLEWQNGFAEIIKHAVCLDKELFEWLEMKNIDYYRNDNNALNELIRKNIGIKFSIVSRDEMETGDRKLLNFGHTIGHAIENSMGITHGHAVSIGMIMESCLSEKITGLPPSVTKRLAALLQQYGLPVTCPMEAEGLMNMILSDKKKQGDTIDIIVLAGVGKAQITTVTLRELHLFLKQLLS